MIRLRDTLNDRIWSSHQYGIIDNCLHTSFRQSKGYLGIHSPPYGGGAGGRGFSLSFVFFVLSVLLSSVYYVFVLLCFFCLYLSFCLKMIIFAVSIYNTVLYEMRREL